MWSNRLHVLEELRQFEAYGQCCISDVQLQGQLDAHIPGQALAQSTRLHLIAQVYDLVILEHLKQ